MSVFSEPYSLTHLLYDKIEAVCLGIIILIRNDIPCKLLKIDSNCNLEGLFVEIKLGKRKWPLSGGYNPHKSQSDIFFKTIGNHLDRFISIYDNILLIEDFNCEPHEDNITDFCNIYNVRDIIKSPTCFKSTTNPSCIDLI